MSTEQIPKPGNNVTPLSQEQPRSTSAAETTWLQDVLDFSSQSDPETTLFVPEDLVAKESADSASTSDPEASTTSNPETLLLAPEENTDSTDSEASAPANAEAPPTPPEAGIVPNPDETPNKSKRPWVIAGIATLVLGTLGAIVGVTHAGTAPHVSDAPSQGGQLNPGVDPGGSTKPNHSPSPTDIPSPEIGTDALAAPFDNSAPPKGVEVNWIKDGDWNIWMPEKLSDPTKSPEDAAAFVREVSNTAAVAFSTEVGSPAFKAAVQAMGTDHVGAENRTMEYAFTTYDNPEFKNRAMVQDNKSVRCQQLMWANPDTTIRVDAASGVVSTYSASTGDSGVWTGTDAFPDQWGGSAESRIPQNLDNLDLNGDGTRHTEFLISYAIDTVSGDVVVTRLDFGDIVVQ